MLAFFKAIFYFQELNLNLEFWFSFTTKNKLTKTIHMYYVVNTVLHWLFGGTITAALCTKSSSNFNSFWQIQFSFICKFSCLCKFSIKGLLHVRSWTWKVTVKLIFMNLSWRKNDRIFRPSEPMDSNSRTHYVLLIHYYSVVFPWWFDRKKIRRFCRFPEVFWTNS